MAESNRIGKDFSDAGLGVLLIRRSNALIQACPIDPKGDHHKSGAITPEQLRSHVSEDNVGRVFLVYEDPEYLVPFLDLNVDIVPVFRMQDPRHPEAIPMRHPLIKPSVIKLHPILKGPDNEGFRLSLENIRNTLRFASDYGLALTIHMDDRGERHETMKVPQYQLSRAAHLEEIAAAFPDVPIIMNHAGSYSAIGAERRQRGQDRYLKAFERKRLLVMECLDVASRHPNLWIETCVLTNPEKADLIVHGYDPAEKKYPARLEAFEDAHSESLLARKIPPADLSRVLIGTDHPIGLNAYPREISLQTQEQYLLRQGLSAADLQNIYDSAGKFRAIESRNSRPSPPVQFDS